MAKRRAFRTPESFAEEALARNAIEPFLRATGCSEIEERRKKTGNSESQIVRMKLANGESVTARVRLCWRKRDDADRLFSAAQLTSGLIGADWAKTLQHISDRDINAEITHSLVVQHDRGEIVLAALIPSVELPAIWARQREVSDQLISKGLLGKQRKNHAANGTSPTLYLKDERYPEAKSVPEVLWSWPGVVDLLAVTSERSERSAADDTYDDCPGASDALVGSDGSARAILTRSGFKRDRRVRAAVLARASFCERPGCGASRPYQGFLDVHHVMGVEKSDRPWTCVALCPNCHREAHLSPEASSINRELLAVASRHAPDR